MTAITLPHRATAILGGLPHRALLLLLAVGIAYHYSLTSLARGLTLQTPLAYLGFVPLLAFVLGWHFARRRPAQGPYDLRLDFALGRMLGLALVMLSMLVAVVVPRTSGLDFWLFRVDLLGMPIFVAGVIALLFGVRQLWNVRFAVLFLFLAWPAPYLAVLAEGMGISVSATVAALTAIGHVVPLATPTGGDGLFLIGSGDDAIPVAIASACSGANSMVGFGLAGLALFAILRGPLWRRIAWLLVGIAITWLLNVVRIELIFVVGAIASPQVALNVLHPIAGIIVFNIGLLVMLLAAGRFGLTIGLTPEAPAAAQARSMPSRGGRLAAATVVVVATLFLGFTNATYAGFQPLGGDQGLPAITGFEPARGWVANWNSREVARYQHGRQFFGEDSTWRRSVYTPLPSANMRASVPVYVDIINTDDSAALAGYSVESCYSFHGYVVESAHRLELTSGLTAMIRSYADPRQGTDWSILSWEWAVQDGIAVRYERVVLLMPDGDGATFEGLPADAPELSNGRFAEAEQLLATMARTMVDHHIASESRAS